MLRYFRYLFRVYDYTNATLRTKILGLPLLKKDNILTLTLFSFPLAQRKTFFTTYPTQNAGGGGVIPDYEYRILGFLVFKTFCYRKINLNSTPHLNQNYLLAPNLIALNDDELLKKTNALCLGLDFQSKEIVYKIISHTKAAAKSPHNKIFSLTQEEIYALKRLKGEFQARIYALAPQVFCYQNYFLPIAHFESSVFYYKHGLDTFTPQTLEKIKNLDIIDVGGFIGDSALVMQDYTDKNIYSFEATTLNYNLMLQTIALNHATRIIPIKQALGSKKETIKIGLCGSASSMKEENHKIFVAKESEEVEIITLDSYVKEHNLKVGFIKVDIEGFEMEFLKGAKETICSQKPAMLISIYHQASDFFDIKPMLESWNLGYRFHIHKPIDSNISLETCLMCQAL